MDRHLYPSPQQRNSLDWNPSHVSSVDPFISSLPPASQQFFTNPVPTSSSTSYMDPVTMSRKVMSGASMVASKLRGGGRPGPPFNSDSPPPSISTAHRYSPTKRSPPSIRVPSAAAFVGATGSRWPTAPDIFPSPLSSRSGQQASYNFPSSTLSPATTTIDIDMVDSYTTPASARISNHHPDNYLLTPDSELAHRYPLPTKSNPPLQAIKTFQLPTGGPITPPLTPPYSNSASQLPSIQLIQSPPLQPNFTTLSARLLYNYPLHPLFLDQYTILEELGSGGFGFVVSATRRSDGATVAVKFLYRAKVPSHGWVNSRHWGDTSGLVAREDGKTIVPMEAYVLRNVRHPGVVSYVDLFEDGLYFYLVMEHHGTPWQIAGKGDKDSPSNNTSPANLPALAAGNSPSSHRMTPELSSSSSISTASSSLEAQHAITPISSPTLHPSAFVPRPTPMTRRSSCDLFECIEQHSRFSEDTARYVFAQIVEVVWALGKIGICHRDIKDENIVVDSAFKVKLIDFGSAVIFDPTKPTPFYNRFHGTTSFASAEILRGEPYQAPSSEIWSLGVLLSILISGECPFVDAAAASIGKLSRPRVRLGKEVQDLMLRALDLNIERRITIDEMRRHPWLTGSSSQMEGFSSR